MNCPDCNQQMYGSQCACGWTAPPMQRRPNYEPSYEPEPTPRLKATPEQLATLQNAMKPRSTAKYWTPERVVNDAQVSFIVTQARHFGHMSIAGRFLQDCIDAGVITADHRLGRSRA